MAYAKISALFAFVLFFSLAAAEISVQVRPVSGEGALQLYPYEAGLLATSVKNEGTEAEGRISIKWNADEGLAISEGTGGVSDYLVSSIESLDAGEEKVIEIKVKPVDSKAGKATRLLSVSYGRGSYDYFAGTYVTVLEPVLQANASLPDKTVKPGSSGEILLSLKNISEKEIKIKSAGLVLPQYFSAEKGQGLGETIMAAGDEIKGQKFGFSTESACTGMGTILLRIEFEDALGIHALEKDFNVECRGVDYGLLPYIALVVLLIIILFYVKQREYEKKKQQAKSKA
ncbi:MAG: hypothetical protein NT067_02075 [Candidatus Diapherotrites archaeon]|nr:hypothetical protein [Candidatus Diapherotrites archaeon]